MKLFNKVAAIAVGVVLATGVGAGIVLGSRNATKAAYAASAEISDATFDFEEASAHRAYDQNTNPNDFGASEKHYTEHSTNDISLVYADSTTTGTPKTGSTAHIVARVAKNTTNSPYVVVGPVNLSSYDVMGLSYMAKGPATLTITSSYSTNGSSWTQLESHKSTTSYATYGNATNLSSASPSKTISKPSTLYFKVQATVTNGNSTTSNRDMCVDDIMFYGESVSATSLESISCAAQSINVLDTVNLSSHIVFTPNDAIDKTVSYTVKSGSSFIDLDTATGVVKGKKGGAAVVTITPTDTSGGATAIDVNITVTSISSSGLTIGDDYAIYANDTGNSYQGELSGVSTNVGTVSAISDSTPSFDYLWTVGEGYYENTVTFKNGTDYLALTDDANYLNTSESVDANSSWKVTWNSTTFEATITNGVYTNRHIQFYYNSNNPRFACYASSQVGVYLRHVEVISDPTYVTLSESALSLEEEQSQTLTFSTDSKAGSFKWYSSNSAIAEVDGGIVTAKTTIGSANIIVYFDSNANGSYDSTDEPQATCVVTVVPPSIDYTSVTYGGVGTLITSSNASTLIGNNKKIVLAYNENSTVAGALTGGYLKAETNSSDIPITFSNGNATLSIGDGTKEVGIMVLTLESVGSNYYLKMKSGKYLGFASTAGGSLSEQATKDDYEWEVTYEGITASSEAENFLQYNSGSPRFKTYKSTSNMKGIQLYSFDEFVDEAETYAANFMNSGLCGANDNTKASSSIWLQQRTAFLALSTGAQNVLKGATESASSADAIQECLARYDRVIYLHYGSEPEAYPDFMDRIANHYVTPMSNTRGINGFEENSTAAAMVVVVTSAISVTAIGGFFLLKKKPF